MVKKIKNSIEKRLKNRMIWYNTIVILLIITMLGSIANMYVGGASLKEKIDPGISESEKQYIIDTQNRLAESPTKVIEEFEKKKNEYESKILNDAQKLELGQAYLFLGIANLYNNSTDDAIKYFRKTIKHFQETNNYFYITNSYNYLAQIYYTKLDYMNAIQVANELYNILQKSDIRGVDIEGQDLFKTTSLSILVIATLNLNMYDVADKFYQGLLELTNKNVNLNNDMAIYSKYEYNLKRGSGDEAKKYANQYLEYLKKYEVEGSNSSDAAYIYLAECYIINKEFDKVPELLEKVETAYNKLNSTALYATLNSLKGEYYIGIGDYSLAMKHMEMSLAQYEEIKYDQYTYKMSKKIIKLVREQKLDVDLKFYVDKYLEMEEIGGSYKVVGEIANSLVNTIDELGNIKNQEDKEKNELLSSLNSMGRKVNVIFIITIITLIAMLYKLKIIINEKDKKEELLEEMVNTDYLTKASSKQYTYDKINNYIDNGKKFYLTMIDIDYFKKINDKYGHLFGDEVLVVLVRLIKEVIKENGFVGRYGGEEFIIIIDNLNLDINEVINEIAQGIQEIKWRYPELKVTISGGIIERNDETIDNLILKADELLYESKKVRNKITSIVK